ncbi:CoA transferase [Dehalococcoidia bacterium]|nr:CoA transferase [Dehalococcoidia bacterium]
MNTAKMGALNGIRVLDMCIILAGPTCGRTLAEYGAEVIKIDPEHRKPALTPWLDVGRGKRSICLDVTKPGGLEIFDRLSDTADVVLQGFRKGVADRLGMGYERLRDRNPGIVYVSINAFGQVGPWATRPGFEQNAQAASGMQTRIGGRGGTPDISGYTFNDYGTGLMAAYGAMMALLERDRTGLGQCVEAALSYTASTFSSPYLLDYQGYQRTEIEGPYARGFSALNRLYQATDGWFFLSADGEGEWERLAALGPLSYLGGSDLFSTQQFRVENDAALAEKLSNIFATKTVLDWTRIFWSVGVAVVPNRGIVEVSEDTYARDRGLVMTSDHPAFGSVTHVGAAPRLSATGLAAGESPRFGGDTVPILRELGYTDRDIERIRGQGAIPKSDHIPLV